MSYAGDYLGSWSTTIHGVSYASSPQSGYWNDINRYGQAFVCQKTLPVYISTFATTGREWTFLSPWGTQDGCVYEGYTYYFLADYSQTLDAYGWVSPWYDYGRAPYLIARYSPIWSGGNCYHLGYVTADAFPSQVSLTLNPTGGYFDNDTSHTGNKIITRNYGSSISISESYHPKRYGYTLGGWANSNGGAKVDNPTFTYAATNSFTKYASWNADAKTFKYYPNGYKLSESDPEGKNPISKTVYYDSTVQIGKDFAGSYVNNHNFKIIYDASKHYIYKDSGISKLTEGQTPTILLPNDTHVYKDTYTIDSWLDLGTVDTRYKHNENIKVSTDKEFKAEWSSVISDTKYIIPEKATATKPDLPKQNSNHRLTVSLKGNISNQNDYDVIKLTKDFVDRYVYTFYGWTYDGETILKIGDAFDTNPYITEDASLDVITMYPIFTRTEKDNYLEIEKSKIYENLIKCSKFIGYFDLPLVTIFRDYIDGKTHLYQKDKDDDYWFKLNTIQQRTHGEWQIDFKDDDNKTYKFKGGAKTIYGSWYNGDTSVPISSVNENSIFRFTTADGNVYRWDSGTFGSELNLDLVYEYLGEKKFTLDPTDFIYQNSRLNDINVEGSNAYKHIGWIVGGTDSTKQVYVVGDKITIEDDTSMYAVWEIKDTEYKQSINAESNLILKRSITDITNSWKDIVYRHCERIGISTEDVKYSKITRDNITRLNEKCVALLNKTAYKSLKPILYDKINDITNSVNNHKKVTDDVKINMISALETLDVFAYTEE